MLVLNTLTHHPSTMIYILVGFVYVAAALLAWKSRHRDMACVYALNAALHWALGACHLLGLA